MSVENNPQPVVSAFVVWAGSNLTAFQIAGLRALYEQEGFTKYDGDTEVLAGKLFAALRLDPDEETNAIMKSFGAGGVHQALDQEMIHAEVVSEVQNELVGEGSFADVEVFRPADALFIRQAEVDLQQHWKSYDGLEEIKQTFGVPSPGDRRVVVTIGHGFPTGQTHFPSQGLLTQKEISEALGCAPDKGTYYIPLQCYPSVAMQNWRDLGGDSVSIANQGRSDDGEMRRWVEKSLAKSVHSWLNPK